MARKRKSIGEEIVEESEKTRRARRKLEQRLAFMESKMTPEALKDKTTAIERWIDRRAPDRVVVKKDLPLFDKNTNSAEPSKGVVRFQEVLGKKIIEVN